MDDVACGANDAQKTLWSGLAGRNWVEAQALLDQIFKPLEVRLAEAVPMGCDMRVLDVGCGPGAIARAVAQRLGAKGHCLGIDISEPMVAAARARAEAEHLPASFLLADAQNHAFEPACFDLILSRFGVMFFDDPIGAFTNLRRASRAGGALRFIAWRSAADNPFMTVAERAAAPLLPDLPPRPTSGPGQFAFADADHVRHILAASGWSGVEITPLDVMCTLLEADLESYFTRLGPLGRILPEVDEGLRETIIATVRAAFAAYVDGTEVRFNAACWTVEARA